MDSRKDKLGTKYEMNLWLAAATAHESCCVVRAESLVWNNFSLDFNSTVVEYNDWHHRHSNLYSTAIIGVISPSSPAPFWPCWHRVLSGILVSHHKGHFSIPFRQIGSQLWTPASRPHAGTQWRPFSCRLYQSHHCTRLHKSGQCNSKRGRPF